ncbi:S1 family peptidase [Photobacterium makurazakiensis]|uniref:trypsin-like serine protease n=1 Tax=Photobacterium makurazakiensis TaxID=2910234 RepID=UPI003D140752
MKALVRIAAAVILCIAPFRIFAVVLGVTDNSNQYSNVGFIATGNGTLASGVLIAPNVILTAAHVVEQHNLNPNSFFRTGVDAFSSPDQTISISGSGLIDPLYSPITLFHDIGLLFLDSPIVLPSSTLLWAKPSAELLGIAGTMAGYGFNNVGHTTGLGTRRTGVSNVVSATDTLLTIGIPALAPGDSGGGLFVDTPQGRVLAGINSFVANGGGGSTISGFISVSAAKDFIDMNTSGVNWYGVTASSVPEPLPITFFAAGLLTVVVTRRSKHSLVHPSKTRA